MNQRWDVASIRQEIGDAHLHHLTEVAVYRDSLRQHKQQHSDAHTRRHFYRREGEFRQRCLRCPSVHTSSSFWPYSSNGCTIIVFKHV